MQELQLTQFAAKRIGKLSKGFRQRVGLAQALVHDPQLLILDEPSSGLDPEQMREMRDLIRGLATNKGIIFSSHMLGEVTELCDSVVVLHQGRHVFEGQLAANNTASGRYIVKFHDDVDQNKLQAVPGIESIEALAEQNWAITPSPQLHGQVLPRLIAADFGIAEFAPERPSLETLFSALINNETVKESTDIVL